MTSRAPHRRFNPLNGEWVLVSPQRNNRPWQGQQADINDTSPPTHDPTCYLCARNTRSNGMVNPPYKGPYVFANDFPAMRPDETAGTGQQSALFTQDPVRGEARVLCFSERHDLTLAKMSDAARHAVVAAWIAQYQDLSTTYGWVSIFENKGEMMGCSNPHPHGQIWASDHIPNTILTEDRCQQDYFAQHGRPLLLDYAQSEVANGTRIVAQNDAWVCVVPFWATWPFETLLLPLRHVQHLNMLEDRDTKALASILGELTTRYDNLFQTDFPYSMGWHGALPRNGDQPHWQLHAHFYPPLLRSATIRKFMVGYELLSEPQRDMTPETAAEMLQAVSPTHHATA